MVNIVRQIEIGFVKYLSKLIVSSTVGMCVEAAVICVQE